MYRTTGQPWAHEGREGKAWVHRALPAAGKAQGARGRQWTFREIDRLSKTADIYSSLSLSFRGQEA